MKSVILDANVVNTYTALSALNLTNPNVLKNDVVFITCDVVPEKSDKTNHIVTIHCLYLVNDKKIDEIEVTGDEAELQFIIDHLSQPYHTLVTVENRQKIPQKLALFEPGNELEALKQYLKYLINAWKSGEKPAQMKIPVRTGIIKEFVSKVNNELAYASKRYASPDVAVLVELKGKKFFTSYLDAIIKAAEENVPYLLKYIQIKYENKTVSLPQFKTIITLVPNSIWNTTLTKVLEENYIKILLDPLLLHEAGVLPPEVVRKLGKIAQNESDYLNKLAEVTEEVIVKSNLQLPRCYDQPDLRYEYEIDVDRIPELTRYGWALITQTVRVEIERNNGNLDVTVNGKKLDWLQELMGTLAIGVLGVLDEIRKKVVGTVKVKPSKLHVEKLVEEGTVDEWLSALAEKNTVILTVDKSVFSETRGISYL